MKSSDDVVEGGVFARVASYGRVYIAGNSTKKPLSRPPPGTPTNYSSNECSTGGASDCSNCGLCLGFLNDG